MQIKEQYRTKGIPALQQLFGYKNIHQVPTLKKISINIGLGRGVEDAKVAEVVEKTLLRIAGQKPVKTIARKSISGFKIRKGQVVGFMVTLRGKRMWDFIDKLVQISFPRMRDFRGLSRNGCDGRGGYSIGFKEHTAFPEIRSDELEVVHGLQVSIATTAKNSEQTLALLKQLGFPLKERT
jgi:large subunit ribosomal protein L5